MSAGEVLAEHPLAVRHDDRDAGAHRPVPAPQRPVALDQRDRADAHPGHVGDRVAGPGASVPIRIPISRARGTRAPYSPPFGAELPQDAAVVGVDPGMSPCSRTRRGAGGDHSDASIHTEQEQR